MTKILLGYGVVTVGGVPIGLTRGGSQFVVEREIRRQEADGDKGYVAGRVELDEEVPKLIVNALEIFDPAEIDKYYPATEVTPGATHDTWTSTLKIALTDHNDVVWVGERKDGKEIIIEVDNAINVGNVDWELMDKDEVVPELEFTGSYGASTRNEPCWRVKYAKGDVHTITFNVKDDAAANQEGAAITFNYETKLTDSDGNAVFANVAEADNVSFTVVKGGFQTYFGSVDVDDDKTVNVELVDI